MRWLPIESAPKDGTVILAWRFFPVAIKWTGDRHYPWEAVALGGHPSLALTPNGFMGCDPSLTHWMPLPAPPQDETNDRWELTEAGRAMRGGT